MLNGTSNNRSAVEDLSGVSPTVDQWQSQPDCATLMVRLVEHFRTPIVELRKLSRVNIAKARDHDIIKPVRRIYPNHNERRAQRGMAGRGRGPVPRKSPRFIRSSHRCITAWRSNSTGSVADAAPDCRSAGDDARSAPDD